MYTYIPHYNIVYYLDREENGRATSLKEKLVQDFRQLVHVNVHGTAAGGKSSTEP